MEQQLTELLKLLKDGLNKYQRLVAKVGKCMCVVL